MGAALLLSCPRRRLGVGPLRRGDRAEHGPDGALFALALIAAAGFPGTRNGWRGLKALAAACAVYLPWALYAQHAFGDLIPLSLQAKALGRHPSVISPEAFLAQFAPQPLGLALLLLSALLLLFGAYRLQRDRLELRPLLLWIPVYYATLWIGRAPEFAWYYVPPLWLGVLLVGVGIEELGRASRPPTKAEARASRPLSAPSRPVVQWACAGLLLVSWWMSGAAATAELQPPNPMRRLHQDYGLLLKRLAAPTDLIAASEVGALAYYSDRRILDLCGLTSKEMLPLLGRDDSFDAALEKFHPAFVMTYEPQGTWSRDYEIIASRPYIWAGIHVSDLEEAREHRAHRGP